MISLALIAALGEDTRAIGKNGGLLWHLPDDLKHFKERTSGHTVIMGRKTWESLPGRFRPLPNRTNIVVTGNREFSAEGGVVAHSFQDALEVAKKLSSSDTVFIIGGGTLYKEALPHAETLYLTLVDSGEEGDVFFPSFEDIFSLETESEGEGVPQHRFTVWKRKSI